MPNSDSNWRWDPAAEYLDCPVGVLLPGDVWMQAGDEVRITLPPECYEDPKVGSMVRVYGVITQGWGSGKRVRSWSFKPDQKLSIRR